MPTILSRFRHLAAGAIVAATVILGPAKAQNTDEGTYAFMATVVDRGLNCGLLADWEIAVIAAEIERVFDNQDGALQRQLTTAAADRIAATPCDDPVVIEWIEASRPGIEREWLSPYLALYRGLALAAVKPQIFVDFVGETDLAQSVAVIDAKFAEFTADGILAEGQITWDVYVTRVAAIVDNLTAAAAGVPGTGFTQNEATDFITNAALIVTLWLADQ